ncbi:chemotaxis protein CheW [bacterium]|nr:chemotaxis protein CheW [bacterium]
MTDESLKDNSEKELQFSCFYLEDTLYGLDIELIQEVNDDLNLTNVPLSRESIAGIMNLRGQIITVIDLRKQLGLPTIGLTKRSRVIIIKSQNEFIGLLIDRIAEVITCQKKEISKPPSNINGIQGRCFEGVFHTRNNELLAVLDLDMVLEEEPVV